MADSKSRKVIEVKLDHTRALQNLEEILDRLRKLNSEGADVKTEGGSDGGPPDAGAPSTGSPGGGSGSTGDGSGGGGGGGRGGRAGTTGSPSAADALQKQQQEKHQNQRDAQSAVGATRTVTSAVGALGQPSVSAPFNFASSAAGSGAEYAALKGAGGLAVGLVAAQAVAKTIGTAMEQGYAVAQRRMAMERPRELGRLGGYDLSSHGQVVNTGVGYGFGADESVNIMSQFAHRVGARNLGQVSGFLPYRKMLSGISSDSMASFMATSTAGGGSRTSMGESGNAMSRIMGTGYNQFGYQGAKIEELLTRMTSHIAQMAEHGLRVDPDNALRFASSLHATNSDVFGGIAGVRAGEKLTQAGLGSAQHFSGQFAGMGDAAMMSYAFSRTSDPLKAIQMMQDAATDPAKVRQIYLSQLGNYAGGLAFAGAGLSGEQARVLKGPLAAAQISANMGDAGDPSHFPMTRLHAAEDQRVLNGVTDKQAADMISLVTNMQGQLTKLVRAMETPTEEWRNLIRYRGP
uniref:Uncharacterized protein n=1 Tax=uncultured Caudovirales phage TaxID=2100421 RepID=A0A6J5L9X4_9CAUD|nr:hypothetical protein UFOVP114_48 [uncultured Caudovirales phage]